MTTKIGSSNVNATIVTPTATQTLTNKTIDGAANTLSNVPNTALANHTISGAELGSNLAALSAGTGISGGPYNGANAVSLSIDNTVVATLAGTQTLTNKTIDASSNSLSNIPNSALVNKTISGVALGSNLASLSTGTGISGGPYNGANAASLAIDNTVVATLAGTQTLTNKTLGTTAEVVTITATAPPAVATFDVLTQAVQYYTSNATANFTLNFRGNAATALGSILPTGASVSVALITSTGSTAYYPSVFQIDGTAVTPKWLNATAASSAGVSSTMVYSFNIIKTATGFLVLGSIAQYV